MGEVPGHERAGHDAKSAAHDISGQRVPRGAAHGAVAEHSLNDETHLPSKHSFSPAEISHTTTTGHPLTLTAHEPSPQRAGVVMGQPFFAKHAAALAPHEPSAHVN